MSRDRVTADPYRSAWSGDAAIGQRQIPVTIGVVVAAVVLLTTDNAGDETLVLVATAVVVALQVVTAVLDWTRWPEWLGYVPPLVQMAAIAVLDLGAGLDQMVFDVLLMLPVLGLAARPGRAALVLALGGATAVLLMPVVLDEGRVQPVLHLIVTLVIVGPIARGVHTIVGVSRRQAEDLAAAGRALAQTAQELRDSRDTLAGILAAATEQGFVATDARGVVVAANTGAERIFARQTADLLGRDVAELVAPQAPAPYADDDDAEEPAEGVRRLIDEAAAGGSTVAEWDGVLPDGSRRALEIVVTPRAALSGAAPELPAGYLFVATDVTRRRAEESAQDEFIGLVSHELRTPLASILGYVELLLLDDETMAEEHRAYLQVVARSAHRLQGLVDDLLASAQIVAGEAVLRPQETDAAEVVRDAVAAEQPTARALGITVHVRGDTRAPLTSDPQRLTQVVSNLVSNAVKYSYRGGEVEARVVVEPPTDGARRVRLSVRDHGRGIAADELEHVTERFYRTRDTRRLRVRGVGLGLSLVHTLVEQHGGTMTITSEPGEGTQVDVLLPDLPVPPDDEP